MVRFVASPEFADHLSYRSPPESPFHIYVDKGNSILGEMRKPFHSFMVLSWSIEIPLNDVIPFSPPRIECFVAFTAS
jgi:hypothetical protein